MKKKLRIVMLTVGILLIIISVPVAFISSIAIDGCCGAPSPAHPILGYLPGIGVGVAGLALVVASIYIRQRTKYSKRLLQDNNTVAHLL